MSLFLNTILTNLDIAGIMILVATLIPLKKIMHELPHGSIRRSWFILSGMILFFIASYIVIALQFRTGSDFQSREIICTLLFLGALFVLIVSTLSLQTTRDIKRIYALEIENITDPLMNISNRRYLDRKLQEEFSKAERYNLELSVLMIDIDHFKNVNDTYGHDSGDIVLHYLGELIKKLIRTYDTVARYGGEEIIVICPSTDSSHTAWLAERLRHEIEQSVIVLNDMKEIQVTVSIGISEYAHEVSSVEDLVKRADKAMYRAKKEGRNRVYLCDGSTPETIIPSTCIQ